MKTIKFTLAILVILVAIVKSSAQDALILRFKTDTLYVKVLEIGTDDIKYKLWPVDESMPSIAVEKSKIKKLILKNGTIMKFSESDFTDPSFYENQRKMAVKIDMFSVLQGTISLGFEKSVSPGRSWEAGLGIIGVNDNTSNNGFFLRGGYKFINTPDYYTKGMRYMHILKGAYVKPELAMSIYDNTSTSYNYIYSSPTVTYTESKYRYSNFALMLNFGKQWVFADRFLVDAFVGAGLGLQDKSTISQKSYTINNSSSYYYSYYDEGGEQSGIGIQVSESGFAIQAGLKIGFLLGPGSNNKK
jgi:hypothetical protein